MNGMRMHWVNRRAAVGLVVVLTVGFAAGGVAQSVAGQAYGSYVNTLAASSGQSPLAVLPAVSGTDGAEADANINILSGLITADEVIANVVSSRTASGAVSNADGSTFANLVVAGVPVTSGDAPVAPNTNISLPGVGYVVLNEEIPSGDGVTSSGLTVNMIHVYLQSLVGGTLQSTGEIIVGSATSSVS